MALHMSFGTVWEVSVFEVFPGANGNEHGLYKTSNFDTFYTVRDKWLNLLISSINTMESAGFKFISTTFPITQ